MNEPDVAGMLKRRGYEVAMANPKENLIFPPDWDEAFENELYELLRKYSFRIFIRDLIKVRKAFTVDDLLQYSTREWVERYVTFLVERGVVEVIEGKGYRLKSESVFSFGETLEWFVARLFEKEFFSPSMWGVRLGGGKAGGDYDVLAAMEGRLIYVEVKSSPPVNIEEKEIAAFLARAEELVPSCAIFLEDTQLRMKDKIVPFFETVLSEKGLEVERLRGETFGIGDKVYITNSHRDMVNNLAFCIRHHLTARGFWDEKGTGVLAQ